VNQGALPSNSGGGGESKSSTRPNRVSISDSDLTSGSECIIGKQSPTRFRTQNGVLHRWRLLGCNPAIHLPNARVAIWRFRLKWDSVRRRSACTLACPSTHIQDAAYCGLDACELICSPMVSAREDGPSIRTYSNLKADGNIAISPQAFFRVYKWVHGTVHAELLRMGVTRFGRQSPIDWRMLCHRVRFS